MGRGNYEHLNIEGCIGIERACILRMCVSVKHGIGG